MRGIDSVRRLRPGALAGTVKDASGAVLPGVTVEASSPVLIEKTRSAMTDATGQYRIESLQPGTYTVTFTLAGFSTLKRDGVEVSGTGVVTIDADMKVGGVSETITVTGATPVVDVQSTKTAVTLDNETMRNLPAVRSYSYLLTAVPGLQSNITDVNTGPVFAIFPVHGGRGVESRLTVEGLNISNPPGGNQPPNYTADIGNSSEVTVMTAGGLGEFETAGVQMNIVPKQGGNNLSGLFAASGFSGGMQSNNYSSDLQARGAGAPNPTYHVYDVNAAVGGPIMKDKLWYYMSVREQGSRRNILNVYYNNNAGDPTKWTYAPDFNRPGVLRPPVGELHAAHHVAGVAEEQVHVLVGRTAGVPHVQRHGVVQRLAVVDDGAGSGRPRRVQPAARPDRALDDPRDEPAAPRSRSRQHVLPVGRPRAQSESDREPDSRDGQPATVINPQGTVGSMTYRSQNWLINQTDGANWFFNALVCHRRRTA